LRLFEHALHLLQQRLHGVGNNGEIGGLKGVRR
jgi:hypothetical protein